MQAAARKVIFPLARTADTNKQNIMEIAGVKNENDWMEFRIATKIQSVRAERLWPCSRTLEKWHTAHTEPTSEKSIKLLISARRIVMNEIIEVPLEDQNELKMAGFSESVLNCFKKIPKVAMPLVCKSEQLFNRIEEMLKVSPAFVTIVKAAIPEETYQVILTDEQKAKIAGGALKLMTKKDGSLMANLI